MSTVKDLAIPLLLGHLIDCILHGALVVQVYIYFTSNNFSRDKKIIRKLVLGLLFLENIQTVVVMIDAVTSFANNFGDVGELEKVRLQWLSVPVLSALISFPVQLFYASRVRILSQSRVKAGVLVLLSVIQAIASLAGGIPQAALRQEKVTDLQSARFIPVVIWLSTTCLCDVSIAGCMLYYLRPGVTELKQTQYYLYRVKRLAVETGALTAGIATLALILWISFPSHTYWATPASIITKVYSNTLLASLNSRKGMGNEWRSRHVHSHSRRRTDSSDLKLKFQPREGLDSVCVESGYDEYGYDFGSSGRGGGDSGLGPNGRRHSHEMSLQGLGGQWVVSPISGKLREESIRLEYSPVGGSHDGHSTHGRDIELGLNGARGGTGRSSSMMEYRNGQDHDHEKEIGIERVERSTLEASTSQDGRLVSGLGLGRQTGSELGSFTLTTPDSTCSSPQSDSKSKWSKPDSELGSEMEIEVEVRQGHLTVKTARLDSTASSLESDRRKPQAQAQKHRDWEKHRCNKSLQNQSQSCRHDSSSECENAKASFKSECMSLSGSGFGLDRLDRTIAKVESNIPEVHYNTDASAQKYKREAERSLGSSSLQVPLRVRTGPLIVVSDVERDGNRNWGSTSGSGRW